MSGMDGAPSIQRSRGTLLYMLAGFLLVAVVVTWQFGPDALFVLLIVAGIAIIVLGIRNRTGWPRPALIVAGVLVMLTPLLITFLDFTFGHWVVTVR
jgi:uncharacterized membrane protein